MYNIEIVCNEHFYLFTFLALEIYIEIQFTFWYMDRKRLYVHCTQDNFIVLCTYAGFF